MATIGTTVTTAAAKYNCKQKRLLLANLVGCNIYISAGAKAAHVSTLLQLLTSAQQHDKHVAVVHAYADPVYNRSSFHLAGPAGHVAVVASQLAVNAFRQFKEESRLVDETVMTHHPSVGFVDHVAVMPLMGSDDADEEYKQQQMEHDTFDTDEEDFLPRTASGWAARQIGRALAKEQVRVLYYASASRTCEPLATVRRERTSFFQRTSTTSNTAMQIATIGAPLHFVENYNVLLSSSCSKKRAHSLTRTLRERDGGLVGVEALTLAYSNHRHEVACNLTRPDRTRAHDIQSAVDKWEEQQRQERMSIATTANTNTKLVEKAYRVGTTAKQCLSVLLNINTLDSSREEYNAHVRTQFQMYLPTK
jgi:glutamate formiminotransferase